MFNQLPPLYPYSSFLVNGEVQDKLYFFNSGRGSLLFVVNFLKEQFNNLVFLIPAYTCYSVICTLQQAKVEYDFVDILDDFETDLKDLDVLLEVHVTKKVVLIATSLFGIELRDYKLLYSNLIIIEDLSQSKINYKSSADFQFVSFGKGKLVSSWSGGVVVTNDENFKQKYADLQVRDDFIKSFVLSNIQKIILKHFWFLIEYSSLNPEKIKMIKQEYIKVYKLSQIKQKWIMASMQCIKLSRRIEVSDSFLINIKKEYLFNLRQNIPYLRLPIKKIVNLGGVSRMYDYRYTYEHAKEARDKEFSVPKLLSYNCSFLPTHNLVNKNVVKKIIGVVNE